MYLTRWEVVHFAIYTCEKDQVRDVMRVFFTNFTFILYSAYFHVPTVLYLLRSNARYEYVVALSPGLRLGDVQGQCRDTCLTQSWRPFC